MKVSVIITCYNYAKYLSRAIRSAINQTLTKEKYEIIVVDDASIDETQQIISAYTGLVRSILLDKNVGTAEARNIGIRAALGQYVVNLDADDYFEENLLQVESLFLSLNDDFGAVSCDYFLVNDKETHLKRINGETEPIACGVMFRKDLLYDIGLYDPLYRAREDEDLRVRFKNIYNIYNIQLPLYRYRKHNFNLTNNNKIMSEFEQKLKQKHEDMP